MADDNNNIIKLFGFELSRTKKREQGKEENKD